MNDRHAADPWLMAPQPQRLTLRQLDAMDGLSWIKRAWRVMAMRPFAFASLFAMFGTLALVSQVMPLVGALVTYGGLPLLGLGYMMATQSQQDTGQMHPKQLIAALSNAHQGRRQRLLLLSLMYVVAILLILTLSERVDGGGFERLIQLLAQPRTTANRAAIEAVLQQDSFATGMWIRLGGVSLVSIPFWHAPALVWWGGQSTLQSLVFSSLALWRNKLPFLLYGLGFTALVLGMGTVVGTLLSLVTMGALVGPISVGLGLTFTVLFYVSLWFSFDDTFGVTPRPASQDA